MSSKEYRDYVSEQISLCGDVTVRPMMGEFLVYLDGIYFGGIFDDRFLVKIVDDNAKYGMEKELPYDGAKPMYLVTELEDKETLKAIAEDTVKGLTKKKKLPI